MGRYGLLCWVVVYLCCQSFVGALYVRKGGWPNLEGSGIQSLGQVSGLGVHPSGDIMAFARSERVWDYSSFDFKNRIQYVTPIQGPTVFRFNATTGQLKSIWGENTFYMPHGLSLDSQNNLWVTDVGLHQVFKYTLDGEKKLELGVRLEPGSDNNHFCKPADVAVSSDGTFYVADGYCNSRILKFSPEGRLIKQWGHYGDKPGEFFIPHSLKLDERTGRLYVADRENGRVQVFDSSDGRFLEEWKSPKWHRVFALDFIAPTTGERGKDSLFLVNGKAFNTNNAVEVFRLDMNDHGKVVGDFGELRQPHDVVVTLGGDVVYVAEITLNSILKYEKVVSP